MKLGEAKPQTRGDHARLEDIVDLAKLPNGKWVQLRILDGDVLSYKQHWINIMTSKTKREVRIPKMCLTHNPLDENTPLKVKCPYCEIESQGGVSYLVNVIVRSLQEDEPGKIRITRGEKESGFKDPSSESWTPVRVLRLTGGLMKKVQELKALNKVKGKTGVKTFDVNHDKFGVDLNIKFDEKAKGPEKYQVNMAEKSPLTEVELSYLQYELNEEIVKQLGVESLADAKKELGRMQIVGSEEFDGGDDDGDDDDDSLGKKKKPVGKKKPAKFDDDEGDDDEDDDDTPPSRGAKKPAGKKPVAKKKPVDDDEDEDDDFDDEDEDDEDDTPPARGKKKPAPKKRASDDEDDDDDDGFDDEDDEEEAPPARGKKKPAPAAKKPVGKKKPADDEDDDDFDDEDEDEDDAPPPKRGAKKPAPAAKKPVGKKKPAPVDDDDEDDEDDEDEEEAPPARGKKKPAPASKKPAAKKPVGKKKPVDDDEDEDDDEGDDEDDDEDDDVPF